MASVLDNYPSTLSPLQLTTTTNLLQNKGLRVSPVFTNAVSSYESNSLISFSSTLLFSLVLALLLIPTLRRLRSELEQTINIEPTPLTDITPWHQKLIKKINNWRVK